MCVCVGEGRDKLEGVGKRVGAESRRMKEIGLRKERNYNVVMKMFSELGWLPNPLPHLPHFYSIVIKWVLAWNTTFAWPITARHLVSSSRKTVARLFGNIRGHFLFSFRFKTRNNLFRFLTLPASNAHSYCPTNCLLFEIMNLIEISCFNRLDKIGRHFH